MKPSKTKMFRPYKNVNKRCSMACYKPLNNTDEYLTVLDLKKKQNNACHKTCLVHTRSNITRAKSPERTEGAMAAVSRRSSVWRRHEAPRQKHRNGCIWDNTVRNVQPESPPQSRLKVFANLARARPRMHHQVFSNRKEAFPNRRARVPRRTFNKNLKINSLHHLSRARSLKQADPMLQTFTRKQQNSMLRQCTLLT